MPDPTDKTTGDRTTCTDPECREWKTCTKVQAVCLSKSQTTASESGDWPTEAMIKAGADTLVSDLDEYKDDIAGFARQIAIDVYAVMTGNKPDGQPGSAPSCMRQFPRAR